MATRKPISVNVTYAEREVLQEAAALSNIKLSTFIRRAALISAESFLGLHRLHEINAQYTAMERGYNPSSNPPPGFTPGPELTYDQQKDQMLAHLASKDCNTNA